MLVRDNLQFLGYLNLNRFDWNTILVLKQKGSYLSGAS
jgi:hypothetical protein